MNTRYFAIYALLAFLINSQNLLAESLSIKKGDWLSTGASNSLETDSSLFQFRKNFISTESEETNIHSHNKAKKFSSLKNYTYTGQMRIADSGGGIGVTFHSKYKKVDQYYRLRSFPGDPTFKIAPHPDSIQLITEGDDDSEVIPTAGDWYNFKVMVRTTKNRTRIRAKVWKAGNRQPSWQIDCSDTSDIRIKNGKLGIWSMGTGEKRWRQLNVSVE